MNKIFAYIKLGFIIIALLALIAIPIIGIVSAAINWDGICYGFTDSQTPCSFWEYTGNEMFWASFIFIPILFLAAIVWIIIAAIQFVARL